MDKTKWGWDQGREVGISGIGGSGGGKCRQLYLNNNKIKKKETINYNTWTLTLLT